MRLIMLSAAACVLLLGACQGPGPSRNADGQTMHCPENRGGLCGIGPQGRQSKR